MKWMKKFKNDSQKGFVLFQVQEYSPASDIPTKYKINILK